MTDSKRNAKSVQTIPKNEKKKNQKLVSLFAGGASAFVSTTVTCPLDVIKTRQQSSISYVMQPLHNIKAAAASSSGLYKPQQAGTRINAHYSTQWMPRVSVQPHSSSLYHFSYIVHNEGVTSLFRGLAPSLIGAVASRSLFFCTYEYMKELQANKNSFMSNMLASSVGGVVCTTATCPLWVIKLKQQLHRKQNNVSLNMTECCKRIWENEGPRGFFRGLLISYSGVAEMIVYFTLYEELRTMYMKFYRGNLSSENRGLSHLPGLMLISGFARCVSCTVCYPAEVTRVRVRQELIQKEYKEISKTLLKIMRKEGWRGLYGGLPATLTRQAVNMSILMGVYEAIIHYCK